MSAFRFKVNSKLKGGMQRVREAVEERKIASMVANGMTEQLAHQVFADKRARREAAREEE